MARHRHRQRHPGILLRLDDQPKQQEQRLIVAQDRAFVVDDDEVLGIGVHHRAELRARRPHEIGNPSGVGGSVDGHHPRSVGVRVDHEHVGIEFGEQLGHHITGRAEREIQHQLETRRP